MGKEGKGKGKEGKDRGKIPRKGKEDNATGGKRICKKTPKKCKKQGGVCTHYKDECPALIDADLCKEASCLCCKASNTTAPINCKKVEALAKCTNKKGKCRTECKKNEKEIKKGCSDGGCKCCAKKKTKKKCKDKGCKDAGGKCKNKCKGSWTEIPGKLCKGK